MKVAISLDLGSPSVNDFIAWWNDHAAELRLAPLLDAARVRVTQGTTYWWASVETGPDSTGAVRSISASDRTLYGALVALSDWLVSLDTYHG